MKNLIWIRYILMALCVVVVLMGWIFAGDEESGVNLLLRWLYIMMGLAIGSMLIMSVFSLAQNPKSAVQALIGLAAVLVVIGIAWAFASDAPITTATGEYTNSFELKLTDTALYTMYVLLGGAVLAIILGELRNAFK